MMAVCVAVMGCYLILWLLAGLEKRNDREKRKETLGSLQPFRRIAEWYLRRKKRMSLKSSGRSTQGFVSRRVLEDLQKLQTGPTEHSLAEDYYIGKLSMVLAIVFTGTLLCTAISLQARSRGSLTAAGAIIRGDYREEKNTVQLTPAADGQPLRQIQLEIGGRVPESGEVEALEEQFWMALCETALGENRSALEIRTDLKLCTTLEGYPFQVKWESADPLLIAADGTVRELSEKEGTVTTELTAKVTYEAWEWNHSWTVTLCPPLWTEEERMARELEAYLVQQEAQSRSEELLQLPVQWQGKELVWEENLEDYGLLLWVLVLLTAGAAFYMKDGDLHAKVLKQQEVMKNAYPSVSQKFLLYLGAGLTIRGVFERISQEYLRDRQAGGELQPVYEEILHTCRELRTGVSEVEAYEQFGRRCGTQEYIRLGALLTRNLKKGSGMLLDRLREESENAVRERFHRSRQLGEEASTRLLMPMMLMLGIVMVVIMVPAFGAM